MKANLLALLHALTVIQGVLQQSITHFSLLNIQFGKGVFCCYIQSDVVSTLSKCATECLYLKRCKSFTYDTTSGRCYYHYFSSADVNEKDLKNGTNLIFSDRMDWPKKMAGSCADNKCLYHEKCLPSRPPLCTAICNRPYSTGTVGTFLRCQTYGCVAKHVCKTGYASTSTDMTTTCKGDGKWSDYQFHCIPHCGAPAEVTNAIVGPGLETENANRTYECREPYTATTTSTWIICQANSSWTIPQFECN